MTEKSIHLKNRRFMIAVAALAAGSFLALIGCPSPASDPGAPAPQAAAPAFSPGAGNYASAQNIAISCATSDASIYYTSDGGVPTSASTLYTAGTTISVGASMTLKAIAAKAGMTDSAVAQAAYSITLPPNKVATPAISPAGGTIGEDSKDVTITCTELGAGIYYSIGGETPATPYGGTFTLVGTATVKAIAQAPGMTDSDIAQATYTFLPKTATPTFSYNRTPVAGVYQKIPSVTLGCATAGASMYYTLDGSAPTVASTRYYEGSPFYPGLARSVTIRVLAVKAGYRNSVIAQDALSIRPGYSFDSAWGTLGTGMNNMNTPSGLAYYNSSLYITEYQNHRIKQILDTGGYQSQFGSQGSGDGQFGYPRGVAAGAGFLYVADQDNHRIQKLSISALGLAFASKWGSLGTTAGSFKYPAGLALDNGRDRVYVADRGNNRIQAFTRNGAFVAEWQKGACASGSGQGEFDGPYDVAVDAAGKLYVADYGNVRIQKFDGSVWSTLLSSAVGISFPTGVAVDSAGNVFIADSGYNKVWSWAADGASMDYMGGPGSANGQFNSPFGIAVDWQGYVYVSDSGNHRTQRFSPY
jgi:hypothetical protein